MGYSVSATLLNLQQVGEELTKALFSYRNGTTDLQNGNLKKVSLIFKLDNLTHYYIKRNNIKHNTMKQNNIYKNIPKLAPVIFSYTDLIIYSITTANGKSPAAIRLYLVLDVLYGA